MSIKFVSVARIIVMGIGAMNLIETVIIQNMIMGVGGAPSTRRKQVILSWAPCLRP
jgi:hypothetical protein